MLVRISEVTNYDYIEVMKLHVLAHKILFLYMPLEAMTKNNSNISLYQ